MNDLRRHFRQRAARSEAGRAFDLLMSRHYLSSDLVTQIRTLVLLLADERSRSEKEEREKEREFFDSVRRRQVDIAHLVHGSLQRTRVSADVLRSQTPCAPIRNPYPQPAPFVTHVLDDDDEKQAVTWTMVELL